MIHSTASHLKLDSISFSHSLSRLFPKDDSKMISSMTLFFNMVLRKSFGSTAAARGILSGASVSLYAAHDFHAQEVGMATVSGANAIPSTGPVRRLHNHDLFCSPSTDLAVTHIVNITDSFKNFTCAYTFTTNDKVPEAVSPILSSLVYSWDSQPMLHTTAASRSSDLQPSETQASVNKIVVMEDPQSGFESGGSAVRSSQSRVIRTAISTN